MFLLLDALQQRCGRRRILPQRPRRDLPVQDLAGNVGVVSRDLTPALRTILHRRTHKADEFIREALKARDPHGGSIEDNDVTQDRTALRAGDCLVDLFQRETV